jgi:hypothetical protein
MAGLNMRAEVGKAAKKPKKEIDHIRVAEAENGGTTAFHHHTAEYEHPPEGPHIFPKTEEKQPVIEGSLFHHLAKHLHIPHEVVGKEGEEEEELEEKIAPGIHEKVAKAEEK